MVKSKKESEKKLKITITLDRNIFGKFKKYCEARGMKISPKIELMIKKEINNET